LRGAIRVLEIAVEWREPDQLTALLATKLPSPPAYD